MHLVGYQPIHRNVVNRRIKRLRQTHLVKLVDELKNADRISITTDFWSDKLNRSFVILTGHYYINSNEWKSKILDFSWFTHRHTSLHIAQVLTSKLRKLNILHKISRITSDGARNLSRAIELIDINAEHIWCVAHRLHLVVTKALALWQKKSKSDAVSMDEGDKQIVLLIRTN